MLSGLATSEDSRVAERRLWALIRLAGGPLLAACCPTSRSRPAVGAKLPRSSIQWLKLIFPTFGGHLQKGHTSSERGVLWNAKSISGIAVSLSWKPFVWLQREARSEEQDLSSGALTNAWFKDDSVTSQVVYVTVLIRDFVKHQERIAVMARQKDNDDELISEWKSLANRGATMNTALGQLYVYLDTQYRAYLD